jgi:hypothetical protein
VAAISPTTCYCLPCLSVALCRCRSDHTDALSTVPSPARLHKLGAPLSCLLASLSRRIQASQQGHCEGRLKRSRHRTLELIPFLRPQTALSRLYKGTGDHPQLHTKHRDSTDSQPLRIVSFFPLAVKNRHRRPPSSIFKLTSPFSNYLAGEQLQLTLSTLIQPIFLLLLPPELASSRPSCRCPLPVEALATMIVTFFRSKPVQLNPRAIFPTTQFGFLHYSPSRRELRRLSMASKEAE